MTGVQTCALPISFALPVGRDGIDLVGKILAGKVLEHRVGRKERREKTAYEMNLCDWSSDVCSSDLPGGLPSMGSHRVRHDRSDLAATAAKAKKLIKCISTKFRNQICSGNQQETEEV